MAKKEPRARAVKTRARKTKSVDREWFLAAIHAAKLTQRGFAKEAGLHLTSVIRLLSGARPLKLDEVKAVAQALKVPPTEVLKHSGLENFDIDVAIPSMPAAAFPLDRGNHVPIVGWVDGGLEIHMGAPLGRPYAPNLSHLAASRIEKVGAQAATLCALRLQTFGSPYSGLDGALLYFEEGAVSDYRFDSLSIVELETGKRFVRVIHRGYEPGVCNLSDLAGQIKETAVRVRAVYPVLHLVLGGGV